MKGGIQELDDLIGDLVAQRDALRATEVGTLEMTESERGSHRAAVQARVRELGAHLVAWDATTSATEGDPPAPDQQGLSDAERAANKHAREQKRKRQEERHG